MSDPAERPLTPLSSLEQLSSKDSRGNRWPSEVEDGSERRQKRPERSLTDPQLCLDPESEPTDGRKKANGPRLKPVEQLLPALSPLEDEPPSERKKSPPSQLSKTNVQYHKLFKEVSREELLLKSYTCALQRDMLYQGKMFVSDNWICFHSKVFGRDTKISIPVPSVTSIKKTKTALLVPNALVIGMASCQHMFVSFLSRNTTYKLLKSVCLHLEVEKTCNSSLASSCENSFSMTCSSALPLDFSDLDGVVKHRRQEMMESSSSDSQTPDYDQMNDFHLADTFLGAVKSGELSVHADVHLQTSSQKHHSGTAAMGSADPAKVQTLQPASLHALLLVYLVLVGVLVLSSCYMAFKISALEHRLNSLASTAENIHSGSAAAQRSQSHINAQIYGELSTNLFTLEKIQKNLQKLLEEA